MSLTGRFNFRKTWFGGLTLEVEEEVKPLFGSGDKLKRRWRRAKLIDLAEPELRALIDLRFQPQFMARTAPRLVEVPQSGIGRADDSEVAPMRRAEAASPQRVSH